MQRTLISLTLLLALVACAGENDDTTSAPTPDATATRDAELADLATIQAERTSGEVSQSTATPTVLADIINTATPEPTPSLTPSPTPTVEATPTSTNTAEPTEPPEVDLSAKLPTLNDVPSGFTISEDREYTSADLASGYDDPEAHLDRLQQWGYQKAHIRTFEIPSPGLNDWLERTVLVSCLIAQYGSGEQVQEASRFAADTLRNRDDFDMQEVSTTQIGEWTLALQGQRTVENQTSIWAVVFAQAGDVQYQCRGASGGHNSLEEVVDFVELMMSR